MADIADNAENGDADGRSEGVLNLSREAHYREHDALNAASCFPFDVVDRLGLHLFLHEVLELKRDGGKTGEENNKNSREYRSGLTCGLVDETAVGGQREEQVEHYCTDAADLEESARVRALAELFDYLGYENTREQEAREFDNVDKYIVFSVEKKVGDKVERNLLGYLADKEEDICKEEHEQRTVLEQEREALLDARRVGLVLGALACVVICKAREHDYAHGGDYRGGQICLRGVILEIGEQSSARDENLRQSADDGAGY